MIYLCVEVQGLFNRIPTYQHRYIRVEANDLTDEADIQVEMMKRKIASIELNELDYLFVSDWDTERYYMSSELADMILDTLSADECWEC